MEINKGIEPFEDRTDFSRGNKDRQQWGKNNGAENFHMGSEYEVQQPPPVQPPPVTQPPVAQPPQNVQKFTHKLANGTTLEAATVEELAGLIEKSFNAAPPIPQEFEDKPLYTPMEFKRKDLSLAEQAEILNLWKENPQAAMRKLQEAEYGATMDVILQTLTAEQLDRLNRMQEIAGAEFVMETETYNATPANGKKLTAYLREKGKPITKQNLVLSFQLLVAAGDKSLLRKVEEQPPAESALATDTNLTETPPPPVVVPSNQGRPEAPPAGQVDVAAFAALPLDKQKAFFSNLRRTQ